VRYEKKPMKKVIVSLAVSVVLLGILAGFKKVESKLTAKSSYSSDSTLVVESHSLAEKLNPEEVCLSLYDSLQLGKAGLSWEAFRYAWLGFQEGGFSKPILAIADFSQSSRNKRLYVIDFQKHKVLLNTYVAHGRNSGNEYANKFSNLNSSYQSSLGFYRALGTYQGKHGLSLRLEGLEKNINDQALARAIVMHGWDVAWVVRRFPMPTTNPSSNCSAMAPGCFCTTPTPRICVAPRFLKKQ
jgi:hypothetical protein